jgi:Domain of unknown function (DUF1707)
VTEAVPPEQIRASDADRQVVHERLRQAQADGALTLTEFDVRLAEAYQARTRGDLARLTADLPEPSSAIAPVPVPKRAAAGRSGETALRVLATIWLSVSVLNLVIWGLVCVTTGQLVYPWWVWVAAPSGSSEPSGGRCWDGAPITAEYPILAWSASARTLDSRCTRSHPVRCAYGTGSSGSLATPPFYHASTKIVRTSESGWPVPGGASRHEVA